MSLWIDVDTVTAVLLTDGWHEVVGDSFNMDAYEYHWEETMLHGGGQGGVCATGFTFKGFEGQISGPLTAILAVRTA